MPMKHYGVWKGKVKRFDLWDARSDPDSPHAHLIFTDDSGDDIEVSINVKSSSESGLTSIVYWKFRNPDFFSSSPIISQLEALREARFYDADAEGGNGPRIDMLRDGFLNLRNGQIPPWNTENIPDDDIVDFLESVTTHAINAEATLFVFGQEYQPNPRTGILDKKGIHQVHMNQGNFLVPRHENWYRENGPHQDGGLLFRSPDGQWEAFFIAFASQAWQTDDVSGKPTGGNLQQYLSGTTQPPVGVPQQPVPKLNIHSALVNPVGPDNSPVLEQIKVQNDGPEEVDLTGWSIQNQDGKRQGVPAATLVPAGGGQATFPAGACYLPNSRDGRIVLKSNGDQEVDAVEYTREQAREGVWVKFH